MACKVIFASTNLITIKAMILRGEMLGFQVVGGVLKLVADFPTQIARH